MGHNDTWKEFVRTLNFEHVTTGRHSTADTECPPVWYVSDPKMQGLYRPLSGLRADCYGLEEAIRTSIFLYRKRFLRMIEGTTMREYNARLATFKHYNREHARRYRYAPLPRSMVDYIQIVEAVMSYDAQDNYWSVDHVVRAEEIKGRLPPAAPGEHNHYGPNTTPYPMQVLANGERIR